ENLGGAAEEQGEYEQARALYKEGLGLSEEVGNKMGTAVCLKGLAGVAGAQGHADQAARLMGAVEAVREALGTPLPPEDRVDQERIQGPLRTALGEAAFAAAWEAGRA